MKRIGIWEDAVQKINGYTPVSAEVLRIVFDVKHWDHNRQVIRITKLMVDSIGNLESRDASLADCMLELLKIAKHVDGLKDKDRNKPVFNAHAKRVFLERFHNMNTDLHFLVLYLHPAGRRVALRTGPHARSANNTLQIALEIAQK